MFGLNSGFIGETCVNACPTHALKLTLGFNDGFKEP